MSVKLDAHNEFIHTYNEMNETAEQSKNIALEYKELFDNALSEFEASNQSLKNKYEKEISNHYRTIKIMGGVILLVAGCTIFLAAKIIQNKCI